MKGLRGVLRDLFGLPGREVGGAPETAPGVVPEAPMSPAFQLLTAATEREFAPLAPVFVALAADRPVEISPSRTARSVLLMAVLDESAAALAARASSDAPLRRFLGMTAIETLDVFSLARAQDRLARNSCVRDAVGAVLAAVRARGLFEHPGFAPSQALTAMWMAKGGRTAP